MLAEGSTLTCTCALRLHRSASRRGCRWRAVLLKALPHGDGSAGGMDGLTPVYGAFPPPRHTRPRFIAHSYRGVHACKGMHGWGRVCDILYAAGHAL